MRYLILMILFCVQTSSSLGERISEKFERVTRQAIFESLKATGDVPAEHLDRAADGFLGKLKQDGFLKLSPAEIRMLGDADFKMKGFDKVLGRLAELEGQKLRIPVAELASYAKLEDRTEVDKFAIERLTSAFEKQAVAMRQFQLINDGKKLIVAFLTYEAEKGREPKVLAMLDLNSLELSPDSKEGASVVWTLVPKDKRFSPPKFPGRKAVLISPKSIEGVRVVALSDGGVVKVDEADVPQGLLKK